jgi:hypothetical protein
MRWLTQYTFEVPGCNSRIHTGTIDPLRATLSSPSLVLVSVAALQMGSQQRSGCLVARLVLEDLPQRVMVRLVPSPEGLAETTLRGEEYQV